jgi:hypothetical protein
MKILNLLLIYIILLSQTFGNNINDRYNDLIDIEQEVKMFRTYRKLQKLTKNIIKRFIHEFNFKNHVFVDFADIKSVVSYRRKSLLSDDIYDIVRLTIVFENKEDLFNFAKKLLKYFKIKKLKNTFNNDEGSRYKVYKLVVYHRFFPNYFIEIQMQMSHMYRTSKITHDFYKILRTLDYLVNVNKNTTLINKNSRINEEYLLMHYHPYFIWLGFKYKVSSYPKIRHQLNHLLIFIFEIDYHMFSLKRIYSNHPMLVRFQQTFEDILENYYAIRNSLLTSDVKQLYDKINNHLTELYILAYELDQ